MVRCGKVIFTSRDFRTDIMLYRDTSYLLLPASGGVNKFRIVSYDRRLHFYICSSTETGYVLFSQFFTRNYPCYVKEEYDNEMNGMNHHYFVNRSSDRKLGDIYFPRLLRNIVNISYSFPEAMMEYSASIRRNRKGKGGKYSIYIGFGIRENSGYSGEIYDFIRNEFQKLKSETSWKFSRKAGRFLLRTDMLSNTFNMINFLRIPEDINV